MLCRLVEQENKPILQVVATAAMKRGAIDNAGDFFADVPKNYDGINAVIQPLEKDCEDIAQGARYNKIPTVKGERYATTELTLGSLQVGDTLTTASGKFVAGSGKWKYQGVYANPYGLTMYIVERVSE